MRTFSPILAACLANLMFLSLAPAASADTVSILLSPFTGSDIEIELTLSDDAGDGTIQGTLEVVTGAGDLRGLFLDIVDDSLLDGLVVTGDDVTSYETGDVINLGGGDNLNGGGSPCPCDIGIAFGSPGMGRDDISFTEFVISHDSESLTIALFAEQFVGARVTSVGDDYDSSREESAKLVGIVPEPGTAPLVSLGLIGFGLARRRRRQRAA